MSRLTQLSASLAATSAIVVSASMAGATVAPPRPTINVVVPQRPAVASVMPIRPAVTAVVPTKTALNTPALMRNAPALNTVLSKSRSGASVVLAGGPASADTFASVWNSKPATTTIVLVAPTKTSNGSLTTTIRDSQGKVVSTGSASCALGNNYCSQQFHADQTLGQPQQTSPSGSAGPSATTGYSLGIVSEANAIGVTPAEIVLLASNKPPGPNDPHVIQLTKQKIAQPSGVTCSGHVVATYGGSGSVSPGGLKNGVAYTGAAGSQGGWVYTCA